MFKVADLRAINDLNYTKCFSFDKFSESILPIFALIETTFFFVKKHLWLSQGYGLGTGCWYGKRRQEECSKDSGKGPALRSTGNHMLSMTSFSRELHIFKGLTHEKEGAPILGAWLGPRGGRRGSSFLLKNLWIEVVRVTMSVLLMNLPVTL